MSTSITDITTGITALTVAELRVLDLETMQEAVSDSLHVLQPEPAGFCTINTAAAANGAGGERPYDITTVLTYRLFYAPFGAAGSSFRIPYAKMADMAKAIIDAVLDSAPPAGVEMDVRAEGFGGVADPSGKMFHGCTIIFTVYELVR